MDFFQQLLASLGPYLIEIIMTIVSVYVTPQLYSALKISADDKRRAYLETAMQNGLTLAIRSLAGETVTRVQVEALRVEALRVAATYVSEGVPEALKALDVSDDRLVKLLEARWPAMVDSVLEQILLAPPDPLPVDAPVL